MPIQARCVRSLLYIFVTSTNISNLADLYMKVFMLKLTMKKIFTILLLFSIFHQLQAQVHISDKIDTTSRNGTTFKY
jgi:hypothetical protein